MGFFAGTGPLICALLWSAIPPVGASGSALFRMHVVLYVDKRFGAETPLLRLRSERKDSFLLVIGAARQRPRAGALL